MMDAQIQSNGRDKAPYPIQMSMSTVLSQETGLIWVLWFISLNQDNEKF